MIYLKQYEDFREEKPKPNEYDLYKDYTRNNTGIEPREEQVRLAEMLEKKFNGLGLNADVSVKEAANCIYKWIEIVISMNLTEYPHSLLSLMIGDLNPSKAWKDRDSVFFKVSKNIQKYKNIIDGVNRVHSLKLVFSLAPDIKNLKIEDPDTWLLLKATDADEAYKKTIKEFTNLIISCSDRLVNTGTGFASLFGNESSKQIIGIRHFINGYLTDKLTNYDRQVVIKHLGRISGKSEFYKAMEYQKQINSDIFNLLKISIDKMQKAKDMDDLGFYD